MFYRKKIKYRAKTKSHLVLINGEFGGWKHAGGEKKPRVKLKVEDWVLKMFVASMKNANDHGSCELISPPVHTLKKTNMSL